MHPFRFGVRATSALTAETWIAAARRAETLGYDVLVMPDHLGDQLSPGPALAAAAAATSRIRLSVMVYANDFRNPFMLAREAASLDVLSGGRFELGMGAGWMPSDYRQLGVPYDRPGRRIDRLEESIRVLKRLLAGETVTHAGEHYTLRDARLSPPPVQRPRPPLAIGGGGPRMLRLAAREADIVGLIPQFDEHGRPRIRQGTERATAAKVAALREAAGPRFEELELSVWLAGAGVVGREAPGAAVLTAVKAGAVGIVGSPYVLYGTMSRVRDLLERRRDRLAITYYTVPGHAMESMAPLVESLAGR